VKPLQRQDEQKNGHESHSTELTQNIKKAVAHAQAKEQIGALYALWALCVASTATDNGSMNPQKPILPSNLTFTNCTAWIQANGDMTTSIS
jgi:hypothetical protein